MREVTMEFLAVTRRRTERFSEADFAAVLDAEAHTARTLYAEGIIRAINGRGDVPGAVIRLEAASLAEARAALARLPLHQQGMMDMDILPLTPYRGFVPQS